MGAPRKRKQEKERAQVALEAVDRGSLDAFLARPGVLALGDPDSRTGLLTLAKAGATVAVVSDRDASARLSLWSSRTICLVVSGVRVATRVDGTGSPAELRAALAAAQARVGADLRPLVDAWRGVAPALEDGAWGRALGGCYRRESPRGYSLRFDPRGSCEESYFQSGFNGSESDTTEGRWTREGDHAVAVRWTHHTSDVEVGWSRDKHTSDVDRGQRFLLGWSEGLVKEIRPEPAADVIPALEADDRWVRSF